MILAFITFVIGVATIVAAQFFAFGCGLEMGEIKGNTDQAPAYVRGRIVLWFCSSMVFAFAGILLILASGRVS